MILKGHLIIYYMADQLTDKRRGRQLSAGEPAETQTKKSKLHISKYLSFFFFFKRILLIK